MEPSPDSPPTATTAAEPNQRCSVLSEAVDEPAYGTATPAVAWFALEQPGPWGREAALQSHLRRDLGSALADSARAINGRVALIRRPGPHPDDHRDHPRRVLVAYCQPGAEWLVAASVSDPEQLLDVDFPAVDAGDVAGVLASLPGAQVEERAQLLVCTNGRRDVCCAVRGRPVAEGAAARHPGKVWETSHTGGHRFAPTAVLLPSGLTLGRLSVAGASQALAAVEAGEFPLALTGPRHDRGRAALSAPAQVAESAVRHQIGAAALDALRVSPAPNVLEPSAEVSRWRVAHTDGRLWDVLVRPSIAGAPRPVSCGRPAEPQHGFEAAIASVDGLPTRARLSSPRGPR